LGLGLGLGLGLELSSQLRLCGIAGIHLGELWVFQQRQESAVSVRAPVQIGSCDEVPWCQRDQCAMHWSNIVRAGSATLIINTQTGNQLTSAASAHGHHTASALEICHLHPVGEAARLPRHLMAMTSCAAPARDSSVKPPRYTCFFSAQMCASHRLVRLQTNSDALVHRRST